MNDLHAFVAIAYRDLLKFLRDRPRIFGTLVFPLIFIVILGGAFKAMVDLGYDFQVYVFTGILAQTVWQSSALGLVSLIEDRENDFSQTIFVAPIRRTTIALGKIFGESLVSMAQGIAILFFGLLIGIPMSVDQVLRTLPLVAVASLAGGAVGLVFMANLKSQRAANQIFPFFILPQFFLAGVLNPINELPPYLDIASRLMPLRYVVDGLRGAFYAGMPEYDLTVQASPSTNLLINAVIFGLCLAVGTTLFVRRERNR